MGKKEKAVIIIFILNKEGLVEKILSLKNSISSPMNHLQPKQQNGESRKAPQKGRKMLLTLLLKILKVKQ